MSQFDEETVMQVRVLWSLLPIFLCMPLFWSLMNQQFSTWTIQAEDCNLNIGIFNYHIEPEQLSVLNPVLLMFILPFFSVIVYPLFDRCGCELSSLSKMIIGMNFAAAAYVFAGWLQWKIDDVDNPKHSVSIWHMFPQYLLITVADAMVSVTSYQLAYEEAPKNMKSLVTGMLLFSSACGDFLTGMIYSVGTSLSGVEKFILFAGLMVLNSLILVVVKCNFISLSSTLRTMERSSKSKQQQQQQYIKQPSVHQQQQPTSASTVGGFVDDNLNDDDFDDDGRISISLKQK
jgi:dipeptide/tripeptide permease